MSTDYDAFADEVTNIFISFDEERNRYVLQLNREYFLLSEQQLKNISMMLELPKNIGLSIG